MQISGYMRKSIRSVYHNSAGWIVFLGFFLLLPSSLQATALGVAGDYNVFMFGNVSQQGTDSQGGVAVGGNASYEHMSIGSHLIESLPNGDLVVGGDLDWSHGSVGWLDPDDPNSSDSKNGTIVVGGNAVIGTNNGNDQNVTYGSLTSGMPIDFMAEQNRLQSLSSYWGGLSANGGTSVPDDDDAIYLTGTDPFLNIFSLDGDLIVEHIGFHINVPETSTTLVNIFGDAVNFKNFGFYFNGVDGNNNPDFPDTSILYNFYNAEALTIAGIEVHGSILAPFANISFNNGHIEGNLIGLSLDGNGEAHNELFNGDLPSPVPEPASIFLLTTGLIGFVVTSRRKRGF